MKQRRADEIGEHMRVHFPGMWKPGKLKEVVRVEHPYLGGWPGVTLRLKDGTSVSVGADVLVQVDPASIPGSVMRVSPVQ
ncbi:hypothetical protein ACFVGM_09235 [Kitasatospora purpeofusca]|uniref:hypothetical protein n=1 Tax=Kitasatospora purpeofusca TaxID=67352 RepID=UPI0036991872